MNIVKRENAIEGEYLAKGTPAKKSSLGLMVYLLICLMLAPLQAMAAIDVAAAVTQLGDINTAVPLVGAAFLAALAILAAWKLIRGAFA